MEEMGASLPINGATGLTIDGLNDGSNSLTFNQTGSVLCLVL